MMNNVNIVVLGVIVVVTIICMTKIILEIEYRNHTWQNMQRSQDWKTAEAEYKHGKREERVKEKEAEEQAKQEEQVVLGGVLYTKADIQHEVISKLVMESEGEHEDVVQGEKATDADSSEKNQMVEENDDEKKMEDVKEPVKRWKPRGIRSEYEIRQERISEIFNAMTRYSLAQVPIPVEWICMLGDMFCVNIDIVQAAADNDESKSKGV